MKKKYILSIAAMLFMALMSQAQPRIAVLNFNAGVGVSQNDVDGLSNIFVRCFNPTGYTMVERTRIDRIREEHNIQGGKLTEKDMVKLGEILNVPVIVIGDVNRVMGQYNVDVRAVNVETGVILAKDGAEWAEGTSYSQMMCSLAERMSNKIPLVEFHHKPLPDAKQDTVKNNDLYRPTGSILKFDLGLPSGIAYGYQITHSLMVGGGVGLVAGGRRAGGAHPAILLEARLSTPKYEWSIFADARMGINLDTPNPFVGIQVGAMYKRLSFGIGTGFDFDAYIYPYISLSYDLSLGGFF